jgi:gluconolactonase
MDAPNLCTREIQRMETLVSGYGLIEGPRVDARGNLHFSDVTNGGVYRRAPDGRIETVVPRRRGVGGIALHADGGLVISGRNICHVRDGETRVLLEMEDVPGFNDLYTDQQGRVYTGSMRTDPFGGSEPRTPGEMYRIEAEGRAVELYGDVSLTNGIGFSPDGQRLYHSDSARQHIIVHDIAPDGTAKNRQVFAELKRGSPDGLAVDEEGGVWTAAVRAGCVMRFDSHGKFDRSVEVPAHTVTSLCFGANDPLDLYISTADNTQDPELKGCIFRVRESVAGLRAPEARI